MSDKPNTELLCDLFNSEAWGALKAEIEQCRDNSLMRLKREGEQSRDEYAGEVRMAETILKLEHAFKNADQK